jgi:toxin FitB
LEDAEAGEILKFLLDTNVISELRKPRPHGGVLAWFQASPPESFATPAIALFELQMGTEILRSQDPVRAEEFDFWISRITRGSTVIPLDAAAAREAARLLEKQSIELMADAMIAAIAKVNGLTVATRNTRDFERFSVPLVNPFLFSRS